MLHVTAQTPQQKYTRVQLSFYLYHLCTCTTLYANLFHNSLCHFHHYKFSKVCLKMAPKQQKKISTT